MSNNQQNMMLNRLKAALAEQGRTNRWLSEQLGKSENTVSRWCTNDSQPTMETYLRIADLLDVELTELVRTKKSQTKLPSF